MHEYRSMNRTHWAGTHVNGLMRQTLPLHKAIRAPGQKHNAQDPRRRTSMHESLHIQYSTEQRFCFIRSQVHSSMQRLNHDTKEGVHKWNTKVRYNRVSSRITQHTKHRVRHLPEQARERAYTRQVFEFMNVHTHSQLRLRLTLFGTYRRTILRGNIKDRARRNSCYGSYGPMNAQKCAFIRSVECE